MCSLSSVLGACAIHLRRHIGRRLTRHAAAHAPNHKVPSIIFVLLKIVVDQFWQMVDRVRGEQIVLQICLPLATIAVDGLLSEVAVGLSEVWLAVHMLFAASHSSTSVRAVVCATPVRIVRHQVTNADLY